MFFRCLYGCFLIIAAGGCGRYETKQVVIQDVTKPQLIALSTTAYSGVNGDLPTCIEVRIFGEIDGVAFVHVSGWGTNKLNGTVDWKKQADWAHTNCVIDYAPMGVRSGNLKIKYGFY